MRELKNVVVRWANNPSLLELCMKVSRENLDMKVHNAGMYAIRGNYGDRDILEAKASVYISDLVHAIQCFVEDGNDSTFTIGNSMYPDAESFEWDYQWNTFKSLSGG